MKQPYLIALILFAPFLSIVGQDETLHPWTDTKGRTLQASFISYDAAAQTVTIKWNGQVFPLPLKQFVCSVTRLGETVRGTSTRCAISRFLLSI